MQKKLSERLMMIDGKVNELAQRYDRGSVYLFVVAIVIGLFTGAAAYALKRLVGLMSGWAVTGLHMVGIPWMLVVLPIIGFLLAALFQKYVIKREIYHGVARLNNALGNGNYRQPVNQMVAPMIASAFTLGFGGSAGSEGPIASTGAAIGSNIGRWFKVSDEHMKILVACGAAAGIAGIFQAPIGGALFALEVLMVSLTGEAVVAIVSGSLVAALTAYMLAGFHTDISFAVHRMFDIHEIGFVALLGVFCGLYSVYYAVIMAKLALWYEKLKNFWVRGALAGLIVGVCILLLPNLYGEGYGVMTAIINGGDKALTVYSPLASLGSDMTSILVIAGLILLVKAFVTASTTSGGGVAGDFAPALFAGCIAGLFFAAVCNGLFHWGVPTGYFALYGMAAVMAATQRAPLMAIFLVVEMAFAYHLILPVTLASAISYTVFLITTKVLKLNDV